MYYNAPGHLAGYGVSSSISKLTNLKTLNVYITLFCFVLVCFLRHSCSPEREIQSKLAFNSWSSRMGWCYGHVLTCSTTYTFQEASRWGDRSTGSCKSWSWLPGSRHLESRETMNPAAPKAGWEVGTRHLPGEDLAPPTLVPTFTSSAPGPSCGFKRSPEVSCRGVKTA